MFCKVRSEEHETLEQPLSPAPGGYPYQRSQALQRGAWHSSAGSKGIGERARSNEILEIAETAADQRYDAMRSCRGAR